MNKENIIMSDVNTDVKDLKNNESPSPSKGINSPFRKPLANYSNNSPNNFGEPVGSPKKLSTSGRVIDSLQREIDDLKNELIRQKNTNDELKKSNEVVTKRRDALMEQLSNAKHEVDTVNSLLQRKQRRVNDLEKELNDVSSSSDDMKFKLKSLEIRCEKLQTQEASSTAEYERIKIAYEAMVTSQKEYREFYTKEIKQLKDRLAKHVDEADAQITKNISMINKSDATIFRSIKSITLRSKELEEKQSKKDEVYNDLIKSLSSKSMKSERQIEALLKISKQLFDEIAEKAKIDKKELLEKYLEEAQIEDPFARAESFLMVENKNEYSQTHSQPSEPFEGENVETSSLVVAKRQDKDQQCQPAQNVEERITSLGKELNSIIPLKDRTTVVEPIFKSKNAKKKSQSRRSSRYIDDKSASRIAFGAPASEGTESQQIELDPLKKSHSRNPSHHYHELHKNDSETFQLKKKKRRRKAGGNKGKKASQSGEVHGAGGEHPDDGDYESEA